MGKLRERMLVEMQLRNYSPRTIKAYLGQMRAFTRMFGRSPAELGEAEIRKYLEYLKLEKRTSCSNINIAYSALKFFYLYILHRDCNFGRMPRPRRQKRLPVVLSPAEVKKILEAPSDLKHRLMLMTTYSAGLRVSETACLKVTDIDSQRMQIRVEQGKGKRDRYTLLSDALLQELRRYWRLERPKTWLFPGARRGRPVCPSTIQRAFQEAKKKPRSRSRRPFTLCATVSPPTCSSPALMFSPSRSC